MLEEPLLELLSFTCWNLTSLDATVRTAADAASALRFRYLNRLHLGIVDYSNGAGLLLLWQVLSELPSLVQLDLEIMYADTVKAPLPYQYMFEDLDLDPIYRAHTAPPTPVSAWGEGYTRRRQRKFCSRRKLLWHIALASKQDVQTNT